MSAGVRASCVPASRLCLCNKKMPPCLRSEAFEVQTPLYSPLHLPSRVRRLLGTEQSGTPKEKWASFTQEKEGVGFR